MELFFDTETSGLYNFKKPSDDKSQPWIVQLGFILSDETNIYHEGNFIIRANDRKIESGAESVHCISKELSNNIGLYEAFAMSILFNVVDKCDLVVCHNYMFDSNLASNAFKRCSLKDAGLIFLGKPSYCTMQKSTWLLNLPGKYGKPKWPKLQELHKYLFNENFLDAHDALADVRATRRCYYELIKRLEKKEQ
jgi:DNA polymerase III epsilon subunit-like protein